MRPVHHHDAVAGEQQVVGPDVSMKQRLACGVGGPGGLQGCQLGQAGTRPRVDAVISGSPGQGPPFGEVSSQVLGDGGHRHRGRVRAAATWSSVASTASSSPSCHGSAGLPACHVVGDEREPWPGLGCPVQARRRQPPGSDQRIQPGEHARLLAVQPGGVEVDLARCRLGEPRGPVRAADRAAIPGLKPPGWSRASITGAPQTCPMAARTGCGTSRQAILAPLAGGVLTTAVCGFQRYDGLTFPHARQTPIVPKYADPRPHSLMARGVWWRRVWCRPAGGCRGWASPGGG
jgi:hypothetical protein